MKVEKQILQNTEKSTNTKIQLQKYRNAKGNRSER